MPAVAAPPAGQPDGHNEDRILKHNPQPTGTHVMRRESITGISATGLATCAKPRVTRTIGTRALDTLVVLPHLGFSFRVRQVDAHYQTSYVLEE
jgi:hypothetical protein